MWISRTVPAMHDTALGCAPRLVLCLALCLFFGLMPTLPACSAGQNGGNPPGPAAVQASVRTESVQPEAGRVLVKFLPQAREVDKAALRRSLQAELIRTIDSIGVEVWSLPQGANVSQSLALLNASSLVEYAEPDAPRRPRTQGRDS